MLHDLYFFHYLYMDFFVNSLVARIHLWG